MTHSIVPNSYNNFDIFGALDWNSILCIISWYWDMVRGHWAIH